MIVKKRYFTKKAFSPHFKNNKPIEDDVSIECLQDIAIDELLEIHLDLCCEINRIRRIFLEASEKYSKKST